MRNLIKLEYNIFFFLDINFPPLEGTREAFYFFKAFINPKMETAVHIISKTKNGQYGMRYDAIPASAAPTIFNSEYQTLSFSRYPNRFKKKAISKITTPIEPIMSARFMRL